MSAPTGSHTQEQFDAEYASFVHSPDWELTNIVRALSYFSMLNSPEQNARLWAVKQIKRERAAKRAAATRARKSA